MGDEKTLPWTTVGRRGRVLLAPAFLLVAIAVYAPVLAPGAGFVWDDDAELWGTRGHLVQADDGPLRAWWPIERPDEGWHRVDLWRPVIGTGAWPLTPTVLWLEWRAFGADARWRAAPDRAAAIEAVEAIAWRFHWPNVLLHALAAWLVVVLLRRLHVPGAAWAGLLFLVHPLCVPSVAWVSELKNTLSLPLLLGAAILYVDFDAHRSRGAFVAALAAFALSLAAKSSGVGLPVVLLALVYLRRRRVSWADVRAVAPFFVIGLLDGLLTLWFTAHSGGLVELGPAPRGWAGRLALALVVPWFYLEKTFLPLGLTAIHPPIETDFSHAGPWVSLVVLVALGTWGLRRRHGAGASLLAAGVAYGAMLFPVLGLFRMTYAMHAPVADHFAYAAMVAPIAWTVGGATAWLGERPKAWRRPAVALVLASVTALAVAAHRYARHWTDHRSLWSHTVSVNPDAWMARYNLGSTLLLEADEAPEGAARRRLLEEAETHLARAIALEPRYTLAHYRHAGVLRELGRDADALAALEDAVAAAQAHAGPGSEVASATMHAALGEALAERGDLVRARAEYESARAVLPGRPAVLFGLADVLEQLGDDREAAALYEALLARHPRHVRAAIGLAWLRASSDDPAVRDVAQARALSARAGPAAARAGPELRLRARGAPGRRGGGGLRCGHAGEPRAGRRAGAARPGSGAPHGPPAVGRGCPGAARSLRGTRGPTRGRSAAVDRRRGSMP